MTGEEFLNKVRAIKAITDIHWHVEGDVLDPDEVKVVVIADGEELTITYPRPGVDADVDFMQFYAIALIVNKLMEQLGNDFRTCIADSSSDAVNYSRMLIKKECGDKNGR